MSIMVGVGKGVDAGVLYPAFGLRLRFARS
jgi:hypothetical protein